MRAGQLRHRVQLQVQRGERNATGEMVPTYEPLATVWAAVEPLSGRELFMAQQVQSQVNARIRMRYRPGLHSKMRALHIEDYAQPDPNVHVYDIEAVIDIDSRRRELHLLCIRREAEGFRSLGEPAGPTPYRVDNPDLRVDDPNWRVDRL